MPAIPTTATAAVLGELLGLSDRRVRQLARAGIVKQAGRGEFEIAGSIQGYARHIRETERAKNAPGAADALRARRAEQIRRQIEREERELISMEEALDFHDLAAGRFLDAVDSVPELVGRTPAECERIGLICAEERRRLAAKFAEARERLRTGKAAAAD